MTNLIRRSFLSRLFAGSVVAPLAGLLGGRAKAESLKPATWTPELIARYQAATGTLKPAAPLVVGALDGRAVAIPAGSEAGYPGFEPLTIKFGYCSLHR